MVRLRGVEHKEALVLEVLVMVQSRVCMSLRYGAHGAEMLSHLRCSAHRDGMLGRQVPMLVRDVTTPGTGALVYYAEEVLATASIWMIH